MAEGLCLRMGCRVRQRLARIQELSMENGARARAARGGRPGSSGKVVVTGWRVTGWQDWNMGKGRK